VKSGTQPEPAVLALSCRDTAAATAAVYCSTASLCPASSLALTYHHGH
jgi:hypothetical protein